MYGYALESELITFHMDVNDFLSETNYISTCENLLIPVEEGIGESVKSGIQKIAKKFHDIFMAFKKWVKKVIQKIKGFFKKSNSEDGPDKEEAKKTLNDIESVISEASDVDNAFKNATEENSKDIIQKADEVSTKMKDLKSKIGTTYLAIPQSSESGNTKDPNEEEIRKEKAKEYRKEIKDAALSNEYADKTGFLHSKTLGAKQADAIINDMIEKNFFKFNKPDEFEGTIRKFLLMTSAVENDNKTHFFDSRNSVSNLISSIERIVTNDPGFSEANGVKNMIRYMNTRIPKALQEFIKKHQSQIKALKKSILKSERELSSLQKTQSSNFTDISDLMYDIADIHRNIFSYDPSIKNFENWVSAKMRFKNYYHKITK